MLGGNETKPSLYRPEIDGLRALAVVAVIMNHTNRDLLPSGYLGVDIFFVISGYVITSSLTTRNSESFFDFITNFYVRRIKRLLPALVFFVTIVGLLICLFDATPKQSLRTGISALFGVSNLYLLKKSTDYFADETNLNVFAHTWSLGVEEQFYLLFPLLFWFSGFGRRTSGGLRTLLILTTVLSIGTVIAFVVIYPINQPLAYFLMPTRFWELGIGCALFLILHHYEKPFAWLGKIPPTLTLIALSAALFLPLEQAILATITVVFLTAATIATLRNGTLAHRLLTQRHIVFVGLISYSLYLWHWGVLSLSHWSIGIHWWNAPILVALMVVMAAISYRFIEKPLRHAEWSVRPLLSIAKGLVVLVISSALLFALMFRPVHGQIYLGHLLGVELPAHVQVTWWKDHRTGKYLERCHIKKSFVSALVSECLKSDDAKSGTVYLVGDSFARNYLLAAKTAFPEKTTVYLTMGYGCAFVPRHISSRRDDVKCTDYVSETSRFIVKNAGRDDVIVIGQRLNNKQDRQGPAYLNFVKDFAHEVSKQGAKVILLDSTVPPELSPNECMSVPWRPFGNAKGCQINRELVSGAFAEFDQLASKAARDVGNLFYAPLRTGLCNGDQCGQDTKSGTPIWHDGAGHITDKAAAELAPLLTSHLQAGGYFTSTSDSN